MADALDTALAAKTLPSGLKKGTLASIVGLGTASMLLAQIPAEESGRKVAVTMATDGTATVRHVSGPQYLTAYLDMVGVATACDGLTQYGGKAIAKGQKFTEAQCATMLEAALVEHAQGVMNCTPGLSLAIPNRDRARFAAVSLAYNIGVPRYCGSTAARMFNANKVRAACEAIPMWNKAGGRVVTGLVARRGRESATCLKDAAA